MPADPEESAWRTFADAEFVTRALPMVENWLADGRIELRLLKALDEELLQRLGQQRARRRRAGSNAFSAETDLRPLCYLTLMAMERADDTLVVNALRLAGQHALMCVLAAEPIAAPTWSFAHRMFVRAEAAGEHAPQGATDSGHHALYMRILMLSTFADTGMSARQIDKTFDWLDEWCRGVRVERKYDPARHYFAVDLDGGAGLKPVDPKTPLRQPRYVAHAELAQRVTAARSDYFRQISVSTLGLYATNPLFEYHDALNQLSRYWEYVGTRHSGRDTGRQRIEEVRVQAVAGFDACVRAVEDGSAADRWSLVDISPTGAGFSVDGHGSNIERGALAVFVDPSIEGWVLGTVVRATASSQGTDVGVRRLADDWRPIRLAPDDAEVAQVVEDRAALEHATGALLGFFIFGDETRGLADSIVLRAGTFDPSRTWSVRPGRDLYRIRLSRVIQTAGDWERVGFDVIKRL
jgi:hypothetical protein